MTHSQATSFFYGLRKSTTLSLSNFSDFAHGSYVCHRCCPLPDVDLTRSWYIFACKGTSIFSAFYVLLQMLQKCPTVIQRLKENDYSSSLNVTFFKFEDFDLNSGMLHLRIDHVYTELLSFITKLEWKLKPEATEFSMHLHFICASVHRVPKWCKAHNLSIKNTIIHERSSTQNQSWSMNPAQEKLSLFDISKI